MEQDEGVRWLEWARTLLALSQNGLAYTINDFDRERFEAIRGVAAAMLASLGGLPPAPLAAALLLEKGYATPKIDVRGALFNEGKLLLVRERADGAWTLPGGWADVNLSPAENVEKEIHEEAGVRAKASKLLACFDKRKHPHPPEAFHSYKLFFRCEALGGRPAPGLETVAVGYFGERELPELSLPRATACQLATMFAHDRDPGRPTDFD